MRVVAGCAACVLFAVLSTSAASSCQAINDSLCASSGYTGNISFPNVFNQSEQEAKLAARGLFYLSFISCSSRINQFLCSAFYPTCNPFFPSAPIEPCLEFCVQVRDECLPLLRSYGLSWPNTLDCDKYFTSMDKNPVCSWAMLPSPEPTVNHSNSSNCTMPDPLLAKRTFVMAWVATCTLVFVVTTVIIVLYFSCTRTSDPIACAVSSIACCTSLAAAAYCVSVATARDPPAPCVSSASPPADSLCAAMFGITYYCTLCTWSWWVALTFQWLARGLNAKLSPQKRTLVLCHVFSWLVPTPFLAACMVRGDLVFDPVVGVCSLRKDSFLAYLIVPLLVALALCCLLILLAHILFLRQKTHAKTSEKEKDGLVLCAGLYTPMCFVVQSSLLLLYSYEYWYTPAPASTDIQLCIDIAKFTITIVINIMTLAWVATKAKCSCHRSTTVDFLTCDLPTLSCDLPTLSCDLPTLSCDLPTLSHTSTIRSMKETSV